MPLQEFFLFFALWTSAIVAVLVGMLFIVSFAQKKKKQAEEARLAARPKPKPEIMEFHKIK
ncbi:MAG: hypothetical protein QNL04_09660 [SAR324 cluster bacterium]|nr:hypothetical protein [SAR324 cluster bacterium]